MHNMARACFIATDGPVVMFDFPCSEHLSEHLDLVDEIRGVTAFYYWEVSYHAPEFARKFARDITELMNTHCERGRRIAVDKMEIDGVRAFDDLGLEIGNGQEIMVHARSIKNENELNAMRCALAASEAAVAEMHAVLRPGMTEVELWSHLHRGNIRRGGEWIETRMLSSGPRTNPWHQECGPRVIQQGDIVAFDTDLIGPYGYCADFSRTWVCGDVRPSNAQQTLFELARDCLNHHIEILQPGRSFRELSEHSFRTPPLYVKNRYGCTHHGVGLCDEYPLILHHDDYDQIGYDGILEPGMVVSAEAYIGAENGHEGVKLEDQLVITENGCENLTSYPVNLK